MVDNGTVSYSNPVRQSLFTFQVSGSYLSHCMVSNEWECLHGLEYSCCINHGEFYQGAYMYIRDVVPPHWSVVVACSILTTTVTRQQGL